MALTPRAPVVPLLKAAAMTGGAQLAPVLAADVDLDASRADEPRRRVHGRDAVLAELARWWPGEATLIDWREQVFAEGALVTLERFSDRGRLSRLRLCLRWQAGAVQRLWAWEEAPRPEASASPQPLPAAVRARLESGTVARRVVPGRGWMARMTADEGREALLPFARLPAGVLAVIDEPRGGWWVLRRALPAVPVGGPRLAAAIASVHRAFTGGPPVEVACDLERRLTLHGPATARAELGGRDLVPKQLPAGWDGFARVAGAGLAGAVLAVLDDPSALVARLGALGPPTLLHGDLRRALAARDGDAVLLDGWALATWAPAALEAAWADEPTLLDALEGDARDLVALARLVDRGWSLGLAATVHPDPARRARARAEVERWGRGAVRALR